MLASRCLARSATRCLLSGVGQQRWVPALAQVRLDTVLEDMKLTGN